MQFSNLSFKKQFYLTIYGIGLVIMLTSFSFNILSAYKYQEKSFIKEAYLQSHLIADNSLAPLMFFDQDGINSYLQKLRVYQDILQVVIYDNDDNIFARYNPYDNDIPKLSKKQESIFFLVDTSKSRIEKVNILVNNVHYGVLYLEKDTKGLKIFLVDAIINVAIFVAILILFLGLITRKFSDRLINPIINLSETLSELSVSQNYSARLKCNSNNEIGRLYKAFNNLFISIGIHQKSRDQALSKATSYQKHLESLTNELEQRVASRTHELQESIEIIKKSQTQLIESEKMVALGSLVSGVAHEVNTPLGNAVTGSSIIKKECGALLEMMTNATLKKSILEKKLKHIDEASKLLFKSVTTAADLIRSFKKISIDQSIERERDFDLYEYVNEVVLTFHNKLKQIPVKVIFTHNVELNISSYPGVYAQLFNNFIQNSILHGFEDFDREAIVTIDMYVENNILHLTYEDNGNGMHMDIKQKAFEPFITTKRNAGGTGLGLNIVYNIIVQKLKGTMELESTVNHGAKFIMTIPLSKKKI